ncbi:hypothetical protein QOQ_1382 [Clostridioides difficile Y171]|nr:hypothetical protein QGC_1311 [Clostridioides difficile CD196]EQI29910.1 hypothetical protein QOQ_1382 [Clostridioides difficile Y171]
MEVIYNKTIKQKSVPINLNTLRNDLSIKTSGDPFMFQ